ncbi:MAG TPA: hypothetical protein VFO90_01150, partial [Terrimicrobiaceae bacterium]|nr:hypothetical protein [Terrimicrobiaceae bacterium]
RPAGPSCKSFPRVAAGGDESGFIRGSLSRNIGREKPVENSSTADAAGWTGVRAVPHFSRQEAMKGSVKDYSKSRAMQRLMRAATIQGFMDDRNV